MSTRSRQRSALSNRSAETAQLIAYTFSSEVLPSLGSCLRWSTTTASGLKITSTSKMGGLDSMPKVIIEQASIVQLCPHMGPHGRVHPTWRSRDGDMGVCQMNDRHLDNSIRIILKGMAAASRYLDEDSLQASWLLPEYIMAEEKLEMLNKERRRRKQPTMAIPERPEPKGFWKMGNSDNMDLEWVPLGNSEIEVRTRLLEAEARQMGLFPGFGEDDDLIYDDSADPNMSRAERDAQRRGEL